VTIKNGLFRDTGNIEHTRHRMSNTDSTKKTEGERRCSWRESSTCFL